MMNTARYFVDSIERMWNKIQIWLCVYVFFFFSVSDVIDNYVVSLKFVYMDNMNYL